MNDQTYRRIAVKAIAAAADVMDQVDPNDRRNTEADMIGVVYELIDAANKGDKEASDLLIEAVPSWRQPNGTIVD